MYCSTADTVPKGGSSLKTLNQCDFILSLWDFEFVLCAFKLIKITVSILSTTEFGAECKCLKLKPG